jgi:hypothetical protein
MTPKPNCRAIHILETQQRNPVPVPVSWGNFSGNGKGHEAFMDIFTWIDDEQSAVVVLNIDDASDPVPACEGDTEPDGDVDGVDLADEIGAGGPDVVQFAADFGRTDCP